MANEFDNPDLSPAQTYYNWSVAIPPASVTNVFQGTVTTVINTINGRGGSNITLDGGTTGFSFGGTGATFSLTGTLVVANGGTGAATAAGARTNLGAAASGVNTDITQLNGTSQVDVSGTYKVGGVQVLAARNTGWTAPTGTGSKAGYDTTTATITQLAQTLKALIDALITQGEIGA